MINDLFTDAPKPAATTDAPASTHTVAIDTAVEITQARRRRDTDYLVEPGADARAIARMLGVTIDSFIADALEAHIDTYRRRLRG